MYFYLRLPWDSLHSYMKRVFKFLFYFSPSLLLYDLMWVIIISNKSCLEIPLQPSDHFCTHSLLCVFPWCWNQVHTNVRTPQFLATCQCPWATLYLVSCHDHSWLHLPWIYADNRPFYSFAAMLTSVHTLYRQMIDRWSEWLTWPSSGLGLWGQNPAGRWLSGPTEGHEGPS